MDGELLVDTGFSYGTDESALNAGPVHGNSGCGTVGLSPTEGGEKKLGISVCFPILSEKL